MNETILKCLSILLNEYPDYITKKLVDEVNVNHVLNNEETVRIIIAELFDMFDNKYAMDNYFKYMFKELDINEYINNPYLKNVKLDNIKNNNWKIENIKYKPFELFVFDDLKIINGCVIPQIGFFTESYKYPTIMQNNRIWMLITPNEINTMKKPIEEAHGNVLTYGLGLGYFSYMVSLKDNVESITIVEKDKEVIELFKKYILDQFPNKNKIKIIEMDAIEYAKKKIKYDYVFVDIWHDPSDGVELYKIFKDLEIKDVKYDYWIENTIKYYLNDV